MPPLSEARKRQLREMSSEDLAKLSRGDGIAPPRGPTPFQTLDKAVGDKGLGADVPFLDRALTKLSGTTFGKAREATAQTEQTISERPSQFNLFQESAEKVSQGNLGPKGGNLAGLALGGLGAATRTAEGLTANVGLQAQRGELPISAALNPAQLLFSSKARGQVGQLAQQAGQTLRGERPTEMGDIARASGVPVISSRLGAATIGFFSTLTPVGKTKVVRDVSNVASRPFTSVAKVSTSATQVKFANKVRETAFDIREAVGSSFGGGIDDVVKNQVSAGKSIAVDTTDAIAEINDIPGLAAKLQRILGKRAAKFFGERGAQKAGLPESALSKLSKADRAKVDALGDLGPISLEDTQALKAALSSISDIAKSTPMGRSLKYARDLVRQAQLKTFGDPLQEQFSFYRKAMDEFKLIKSSLTEEQAASQIFGGGKLVKNPAVREAFKKFAGRGGQSGRELASDVSGAAGAASTGRMIKRLGGFVLRTVARGAAIGGGGVFAADKLGVFDK